MRLGWLLGAAIAATAAVGVAISACDQVLSMSDIQTGPCPAEGAAQCSESGVPMLCGADGQWTSVRCKDGAPLACNEAGEVKALPVCEESYPCVPETGRCRAKWVDLLFVIDNSSGAMDKQAIVVEAIPELVAGFLNPRCLDPANPGDVSRWRTPDSPTSPCPAGLEREHEPLVDMHIGIVSSSLGGHGSDICPDESATDCSDPPNTSQNDKGRLLSREGPCLPGVIPTYQDKGFLAWDPRQSLSPAGEADMGALTESLKTMTRGVGQLGCPLESQLEAWYRFLVDPEPPLRMAVLDGVVQPVGVDDVVLQQRKDFLRPDSLLIVLLLTDEDDCSVKEYGPAWVVGQLRTPAGGRFHLPRPRSECATDPNSPCCRSCGSDAGDCPPDPGCSDENGNLALLTDAEDPMNLRCWDSKRRFGEDVLYEIDRYTTALTKPKVPNRTGELVQNPIFATDENGVVLRDKDRVFFGGLVGVPWQDIAKDPADLSAGTKSATEMNEPIAELAGATTWDVILGDPASYVEPLDPHMIPSIDPRSGVNPITGDPIAPPGSPDGANPINGHEYTIPLRDDLQYACIFDLPEAIDCRTTSPICACRDGMNDSPLCADNGMGERMVQTRAAAVPGLRVLSLMKSLGPQAVVGSVCPRQLADPTAPDHGYRPFVRALFDAVKGVLPRPPALDATRLGQPPPR